MNMSNGGVMQRTGIMDGKFRGSLNNLNSISRDSGSNFNTITKETKNRDTIESYCINTYLEQLITLIDLEANDFDFVEFMKKNHADALLQPMRYTPDGTGDSYPSMTGNTSKYRNDVFDYLASGSFTCDIGEQDFIFRECLQYYADVLIPFGKKVVKRIKTLLIMHLPPEVLCSEYYASWKEETLRILERFRQSTETCR